VTESRVMERWVGYMIEEGKKEKRRIREVMIVNR
jgi:hypothetical protein